MMIKAKHHHEGANLDRVAENEEMKAQLNKMKKPLGYTSEDATDERIASIEYRVWTHPRSSRLHVSGCPRSQAGTVKSTHIEIREVDALWFDPC